MVAFRVDEDGTPLVCSSCQMMIVEGDIELHRDVCFFAIRNLPAVCRPANVDERIWRPSDLDLMMLSPAAGEA